MRLKRLVALLAVLAPVLLISAAQAQFGTTYPGASEGGYSSTTLNISRVLLTLYVVAGIIGLTAGAILSPALRQFRMRLLLAAPLSLAVISLIVSFPTNVVVGVVASVMILVASFAIGKTLGASNEKSRTFGSAQWATFAQLRDASIIGEQGLALGYFGAFDHPLHYTGDRHLLTVAPTRAGKGVGAIIPNLLTYRGSALVVDPKGENAVITAARRGAGNPARGSEGLGQKVYVVDPWGITGMQAACFNPLDWIDPTSPEAGENAMMLADALVVSAQGGTENPFWNEEAKALLMGLILYVCSDTAEEGNRHLGRVRDIISLPGPELLELCVKMSSSTDPIIASTGARTASKEPRLLGNVLASAQAQTHFLDSPSLRHSLSHSDFRFEDLKRQPMTVYLVLPADRLGTFGRWLRLLIQQAITVTARNVQDRPAQPILFMLDEMAALGRLTMVEQAYSLMAGFGMQLWGIVQDLSQLHRIYGSRDLKTADYFSDLCGSSTVETVGSSVAKAIAPAGAGGRETVTSSAGEGRRPDYGR
jgi:type IV secretion system protein VirD4